MVAQAEQVVTKPFLEVVERGNEAITNAEDAYEDEAEVSALLFRAGQALVKEGERALKRLRPMVDEQVSAGRASNVKDLMAQNTKVVEQHRVLDDLLYDFEDYTDLGTFDDAKFKELQASTKGLALAIMEAIRIRTLEGPKEKATAFPPLPPLPPLPPHVVRNESHAAKLRSSSATNPLPPPVARENVPRTEEQLLSGGLHPPPPPRGAHPMPRQRPGSRQSMIGEPAGHPSGRRAAAPAPVMTGGNPDQRQPPTPTSLPMTPRSDERDSGGFDFGLAQRNTPSQHLAAQRKPSRDPPHEELEGLVLTPESPQSPADENNSQNFANMGGLTHAQMASLVQQFALPPGAATQELRSSSPYKRYTSSSTGQSSTFDQASMLSSNRTSVLSGSQNFPGPRSGSIPCQTIPTLDEDRDSSTGTTLLDTATTSSQGGAPTATLETQSIAGKSMSSSKRHTRSTVDDDTKSVAGSTTSKNSVPGYPSWRIVDRALNDRSTFREFKGFCSGARSFRHNGAGDAVKRVGGGSSNSNGRDGLPTEMLYGQMYTVPDALFADPIAQCVNCDFGHKYAQLLQDSDKDSVANAQSHGVWYRKRFLYKSHLSTRNMNRAYYACLFCSQAGKVPREGDATVFPSPAMLFRHIARHPQPLPAVPGVTVLYGTIDPQHPSAQDYDVHLPHMPQDPGGPPEADLPRVSVLPAAVAVRDHLQQPDEKPLAKPDHAADALQFFVGARIVGVEYPEQWGGKWCQGWHDGAFGAFPAKAVQLEAPRRGRSITQGQPQSLRTGVSKWKWDAKTCYGSGWLGFDKGEQISNLEWDDPDAWYWIGTTSKGKYGIFPSSHMKIESVRDGSLEKTSSNQKPKKGFKLFGRG